MKKRYSMLAAFFVLFAIAARGQDAPPLKLVQTLTLPAEVKGNFDHFGVDVKGDRLFATPEGYKAVLVFELKNGKPIHTITGIGKPHAVLYREDLNRIYITDGDAGDVKIFDGKTYALLSSVKLLEDADSIGYDPKTKSLYVDNDGGDVHETYSMLSVVDTTVGKKLADIKIDGDTLEAMALESSSPRLYVNNKAKNQVDVVDREKRAIVSSWPVTKCKTNVAMAFDEANHRLFIACRTGQIAVLDTQSGKEITALPITKGVDDVTYDPASRRILCRLRRQRGRLPTVQPGSIQTARESSLRTFGEDCSPGAGAEAVFRGCTTARNRPRENPSIRRPVVERIIHRRGA